MHVILLAGGGGTRLWPLSRADFPKQFLHFGDKHSLLEKTAKRFLASSTVKQMWVATNIQYFPLVQRELKKLPTKKEIGIFTEPGRKNTAPAIALVLKFLQETHQISQDTPILISPSDHVIEPEQVFLKFIDEVPDWVTHGEIILFGIPPVKPETGYGYIQVGKKAKGPLFFADRFVEKPDAAKAKEYCSKGNFYWNSGIFAFSVRTFWRELAECAPDISRLFLGDYTSCLNSFSQVPEISFDYAVLEKSKRVLVCPLPVSWSDVGSWDSVYETFHKDSNQNVIMGNVKTIETKNSLIFSEKKLISTVGIEDLLIIETEEMILISKRTEAKNLKSFKLDLPKNQD